MLGTSSPSYAMTDCCVTVTVHIIHISNLHNKVDLWSRALAAILGDSGLVPSTHNHNSDSSQSFLTPGLGDLVPSTVQCSAHTYFQIKHSQIKTNKAFQS